MKTTNRLLALSLLTILISCEKPKEMDDGRPRIKSVSIAGLPAENVRLDPKRYTITIQLPALVPEGGLVLTLELTENTEILEGLTKEGELDFTATCNCDLKGKSTDGRILIANNQKTATYRNTTNYRVIFLPLQGSVGPNPNQPISYQYGMLKGEVNKSFIYLSLPVRNLYQNPKVISVSLKNRATGKALIGYTSFYFNYRCINGCYPDLPNRMAVTFLPFLDYFTPGPTPGQGAFEVSLRMVQKADTVTLTFPQPLELKD